MGPGCPGARPSPELTVTRVGNDVVDLGDPRTGGKAADERFVARIFTGQEAESIRSAASPDRALWIRWAAKEAAFKVASKLLGAPPPFEHAAFRVRLVDGADARAAGSGRVRYRNLEIPVTAEATARWIHVLARHAESGEPEAHVHREVRPGPQRRSPSDGWEDELRNRFTDREWRAVHGPASALVRLRARSHLARVLGVEEEELEIVCDEGPPGRTPPRVVLRGEGCPGDVSLSHHGRFVAWAFTIPGERRRSPSGRP